MCSNGVSSSCCSDCSFCVVKVDRISFRGLNFQEVITHMWKMKDVCKAVAKFYSVEADAEERAGRAMQLLVDSSTGRIEDGSVVSFCCIFQKGKKSICVLEDSFYHPYR